ncbi:MAG: MurR/RpiR family transcriptional regulator, partial [Paracoccaceae bacterium]
MFEPTDTVSQRLKKSFAGLTRAERQLADIILENYPVSGLGTITIVANSADVSTPTVARMVQKIGYKGFSDFQAALRRELQDKVTGPIAKLDVWAEKAPGGHILNRFTDAVIGNIRQTLNQIEIQTFDNSCSLLSDLERAVFVVGGRITRSLADYFLLHMQVARPDVTHIQSITSTWPHYLQDIKPGDVLV